MKFSHALVVVLALHVIAVGGVFAFNSIKARTKPPPRAQTLRQQEQGAAQSKPSPSKGAIEGWAGKTHTVQAGDTLSRIAALYKISLELLEKENGITTYSMIRVGQVLKIPCLSGPGGGPKPATDPLRQPPSMPFSPPRTDIAKPPAVDSKTDIVKPPVAAAKTESAQTAGQSPPRRTSPSRHRRRKTDSPASTAAAKTDIAKPPAAAAKTDVTKPAAVAHAAPNPAATAPSPKPAEVPPAPTESDVYVVAKGDNPYNIAKKLHVSYNDLIAINEIKDPTRVQIGQKLKIPAKKN